MKSLNRLQSWIFWRNASNDPDNVVSKLLKALGYRFPDQSIVYENLRRSRGIQACPFCDGWGAYSPAEETEVVCLCSILRWQHSFSDIIKEYSIKNKHTTLSDFIVRGTPNDKPQIEEAIALTKRWIRQPDFWVLFIGGNGTGKTHMMGGMRESVKPISIYTTAGEFEAMMFKLRNGNVGRYVDALTQIPILFFDDWGMEYSGPWVNTTLNNIINARYSDHEGLVTIVATNMKMGEAADLNKRVASRLSDKKIVTHLVMSVSDARRDFVNG